MPDNVARQRLLRAERPHTRPLVVEAPKLGGEARSALSQFRREADGGQHPASPGRRARGLRGMAAGARGYESVGFKKAHSRAGRPRRSRSRIVTNHRKNLRYNSRPDSNSSSSASSARAFTVCSTSGVGSGSHQ